MSEPTPIKGRCGICDWPTNRLPCPYCSAVRRAEVRAALDGPMTTPTPSPALAVRAGTDDEEQQ